MHDGPGALEQWRRVFGAGVMFETIHDDLDGSDMGMVWMGSVPFLALASSDSDGLVGRWIAKNGPGVQSLAWEVPDMWASQNYLQQAGIGITGVHVEGRHFFMHPRDTFGLMLELTDDRLPGDPRNGLSPTGGGDGLVPVSAVAHVTAVVVDLDPVAALLHQVFGVEPGAVAGDGPETIADFDIGDLTLRVVAPHDASSAWHEFDRERARHPALGDPRRRPRHRARRTRDRGNRHRTRGGRSALARPRRHLRDPAPARRSGVTRPPGGGMLV